MTIRKAIREVDPIIGQSLKYPLKNDQVVATVVVGSTLILFLRLINEKFIQQAETSATYNFIIFLTGWLVLLSILAGYYIRVFRRLAEGNEVPPSFNEIPRMLFEGFISHLTIFIFVLMIEVLLAPLWIPLAFIQITQLGIGPDVQPGEQAFEQALQQFFAQFFELISPAFTIFSFILIAAYPAMLIVMSKLLGEKGIEVRPYSRFVKVFLFELFQVLSLNYLYGWLLVIITIYVSSSIGSGLGQRELIMDEIQLNLIFTGVKNISRIFSSLIPDIFRIFTISSSIFYFYTVVSYIFGKVMASYLTGFKQTELSRFG